MLGETSSADPVEQVTAYGGSLNGFHGKLAAFRSV